MLFGERTYVSIFCILILWGPTWGPSVDILADELTDAFKALFFNFFVETSKFTFAQGPRLGPRAQFFHTNPSGLIWAIAGIKNECKRTRRSFYIILESALCIFLKKVLGHLQFRASSIIQNQQKITYFGYARCRTSKIWSRIDMHLIFFSSESWDVILANSNILGPHMGPHSSLSWSKQMTLSTKNVKKNGFFLVIESRGPTWGPKHVSEKKCHNSSFSEKIFGAPLGAPRLQNPEKNGFFAFFGAALRLQGIVGAPNGAPSVFKIYSRKVHAILDIWTT